MSLPQISLDLPSGDHFTMGPLTDSHTYTYNPDDPAEQAALKELAQDDMCHFITQDWFAAHVNQPSATHFFQGRAHLYGVCTAHQADPTLAAYYFLTSAIEGLPEGLYKFAKCCEKGVGVPKNVELAKICYQEVSERLARESWPSSSPRRLLVRELNTRCQLTLGQLSINTAKIYQQIIESNEQAMRCCSPTSQEYQYAQALCSTFKHRLEQLLLSTAE
jgi:hypothetical protein